MSTEHPKFIVTAADVLQERRAAEADGSVPNIAPSHLGNPIAGQDAAPAPDAPAPDPAPEAPVEPPPEPEPVAARSERGEATMRSSKRAPVG